MGETEITEACLSFLREPEEWSQHFKDTRNGLVLLLAQSHTSNSPDLIMGCCKGVTGKKVEELQPSYRNPRHLCPSDRQRKALPAHPALSLPVSYCQGDAASCQSAGSPGDAQIRNCPDRFNTFSVTGQWGPGHKDFISLDAVGILKH